MRTRSKRFSTRFKKLHGINRGIHRAFKGSEAESEMLLILKGNEAAWSLANEVASFYGNYLEFYENKSYSRSRYEIGWGHKPVKLRFAAVRLQLGTNRTAEALTHELLHLRLPIQGFPSCEQVNVPDELDKYAKDFIQIIELMGNLIGHELTFPQFLLFGFEGSKFLGPPLPAPNYEEHAGKAMQSRCIASALDFPWWCLEYYRHWVSTRHGVGKDALRFAESAEHWGSRVYPDLSKTFCMMRGWTLRGEFKD